MKIEDVIKSTVPMENSKKIILNIMYTQNILAEKFNEILKHYDISGEQYNVLRILRGQKGNPANMCVIQERMLAKTSNTTRLVDKLLLKELDPKVKNHEESFSKNLNEEEVVLLNQLLEKYRN